MGLFLAVAVPIDLPRKNVFVAYNFEANYLLPTNETIEEGVNLFTVEQQPSEEARTKVERFNRTIAYKILERKIQTHGYPGRECLLRTICELSASTLEHNGVLGELLHVIFSPSTSEDEKLPQEYNQAEIDGKTHGICKKYNSLCEISFMDLVTWIDNLTYKN